MINSPRVELVETSFDDPIVTGLHVEQAAELAARFGVAADRPSPAEPGMVFLVARERAALIGCAGVRWISATGIDTGGPSSGGQGAEVGHVYVRPEYRGLGVTRLLLRGAEDLARRRGCRIARLKAADLREAGLYEASGYVRIPPFGSHSARSICFEKTLRADTRR
ncbi:GNAT family N-acetyltransferase [Actinoallomurus purpureus]|uniref:GNAT family N-acetyltransferase n=1 Tax=Actinoallomurus purpureus TaxID=478114 RepID=UPI0020922C30|nr:GNAT family N-acetyltransferase [Actinoallomurus purpureus]MCO6011076.1 GNAT family N-acetyltransferase [Actinoallomurus purpureus]